jgi:hypothetical protein
VLGLLQRVRSASGANQNGGFSLRAAFIFWVAGCGAGAQRGPTEVARQHELDCTVTTSGETRIVRVPPTNDPYGAPEIPEGDYFALKFVYVAAPADLAALRVYTFERNEAGAVRLVHEARYAPPFAPGSAGFTGREFVYDTRGDELAYCCAWNAR